MTVARREENRFEPSSRTGKGVVARATLYFLIRYPGKIAAAGGEFDSERLPMLLDWHQQTPPDEYEKHRNTAIFAVQGNRNPLIDYPNWAKKIDFQLGFGQSDHTFSHLPRDLRTRLAVIMEPTSISVLRLCAAGTHRHLSCVRRIQWGMGRLHVPSGPLLSLFCLFSTRLLYSR